MHFFLYFCLDERRCSLTNAVAGDQITSEMGRQLLSAMNRNSLANSNVDLATGRYVDPQTHESMSVEAAIDAGLLDPCAVFAVDPVSGRPVSLATLIDSGSFNPVSGKIRNPSSGVEISVAIAEQSGVAVADFSVDKFIPPRKLRVSDLDVEGSGAAILLTPGGQEVSLQDALAAGLVSGDTAVQLDRASGCVTVVDPSQAELVDALVTATSVADWLNDVEQRLASAGSDGMDLGNVASVQREIASLEVSLSSGLPSNFANTASHFACMLIRPISFWS